MREFETLKYKEANFRIHSDCFSLIKDKIIEERKILERYIKKHPLFLSSLIPVEYAENAPDIVRRMCYAAEKTKLGPMASVAGTFSQIAVEAALKTSTSDVIVENGGDIYLNISNQMNIGIYAGKNKLSGKLAFLITPDLSPLSICSSSSLMGHSQNFGNCDLAVITSKNGALADSAATLTCNSVKVVSDINRVLKMIMNIDGIEGILIIKDDKIALAGNLPSLIKNADPEMESKITKDSSYFRP